MLLASEHSETVVISFDEISSDLIPISERFPAGFERQLGYFESARFVIFQYEPLAEGVLWNDGRHSGFGCGSWRGYAERIEPAAARHGVRLGGRRDRGMVLLIDRLTGKAYFAPWHTANDIIATMQSDTKGFAASRVAPGRAA